jgi:hypothetical protein
MTPQQLIGIGVRLFAVWLGLVSVSYFVSVPTALAASGLASVGYAIGAAYLAGALALWFFPMFVAHKLLPRTQFENRLSFQAHELARVGCSLFGLWLFAKTLPTVAWFIFRSFLFIEASSSFSAISTEAKLELAVSVFELAVGLLLIAKAGVFARIVIPKSSTPATPADDL